MTPTPATRDDIPEVLALLARIWEEYGFIWAPEVEFPDLHRFDVHYTAPRGGFWVVRGDDGRVVGSIGVDRIDEHTAEIHRLYVDPGLRGRGLGRTLVDTALEWARAERLPRMVLWSDTRFTSSHRLYERLGFTRLGIRTVPDDPNDSREYRFERDI